MVNKKPVTTYDFNYCGKHILAHVGCRTFLKHYLGVRVVLEDAL